MKFSALTIVLSAVFASSSAYADWTQAITRGAARAITSGAQRGVNKNYISNDSASEQQRWFGPFRCKLDCSGHIAGYKWARDNFIFKFDECKSDSESFTEGCNYYLMRMEDDDLEEPILLPFVNRNLKKNADRSRPANCLLIVGGQQLIRGQCTFRPIGTDGSFQIYAYNGKYFAYVHIARKGVGQGWWNEEPYANHAHTPLGELYRQDGCWVNSYASVCAY